VGVAEGDCRGVMLGDMGRLGRLVLLAV